jgi:hypothetical protein
MSAVALARAVNLDPAVVERFERGDARAPDRQLVLDLAMALGLNENQTDELLWSANHLPLRVQGAEPRDARTVALLVDHENVYIALNELVKGFPPDLQLAARRKVETAAIAYGLRSAAEQIGWIKVAKAFADWERLPTGQREYAKLRYEPVYNLSGRNNADLKLSDAIRDMLEADEYDDVDTYVIVSGDGGYLTVLDTLLRRQKQVVVWGVRGATNALLHQNATDRAWVEDLLGLPQPRPTNGRADGDEHVLYASNHTYTNNNNHFGVAEPPRTNGGGLTIGNEVSRLEAMAIHLSRHLRQRSWSYITFVRFLSFLAETGVFGASREEQLAWLSHAKETGVLREEILDDPGDPTRIARRFHLNETHPLVERARAICNRVSEVVPAGGRGLAFGVVIDRLVSTGDIQLTDVQAKNWLTWFTDNGYLQAEQVPHFRKEGVTVTLLRQTPGYWDQIVQPEVPGDRDRLDGLAEACVVRLADFLERHPHFAWMALSQLLNQMSDGRTSGGVDAIAQNRQRAKQAVAMASDNEYIAVEQIPNLKTGGATTVARLNRDAPRVSELLALREALVRRLAEMLISRSSVSRALFQASIVEKLGLTYEEAAAWVDLLVSEGLFTLDLDHDGTPTALRVDHQDLIVSRILFSAMQAAAPEAQRS